MIAAENVLPEFGWRRSLTPDEVMRLQEPAVIFETERSDEDGERAYLYTVAGWLDGVNVATHEGGCTFGGDIIVIHAQSRREADDKACRGLADTIEALHGEAAQYAAAQEALFRLESVNALRRHELATKPDAEKVPEFEEDMAAIVPLRGDDIILTTTRH